MWIPASLSAAAATPRGQGVTSRLPVPSQGEWASGCEDPECGTPGLPALWRRLVHLRSGRQGYSAELEIPATRALGSLSGWWAQSRLDEIARVVRR